MQEEGRCICVHRYGAIPVVRKTGGLNDTVFDVDDDKERASASGMETNGYSFEGTDTGALDYGLNRYDLQTHTQLLPVETCVSQHRCSAWQSKSRASAESWLQCNGMKTCGRTCSSVRSCIQVKSVLSVAAL